MPDRDILEIAIEAAGLVKAALALADRAQFSLVAIHLSDALAAIEREMVLSSGCSN